VVVPVWPKKFAREEILRTPFTFPHGVMYMVLRRTVAPSRFGSMDGDHGDYSPVGQIGPCNEIRSTKSDTTGEAQAGSPRLSITLGIPIGSDVQKGDRLRAPDGEEFDVEGIPEVPKNPFTGWTPRMHVGLTRTRFEGGDA